MRSRYSAFVKGKIDYLVETHHPATRPHELSSELQDYLRCTQFLQLKIVKCQTNTVEFIAILMHNGELTEQREKSLFKKVEGKWYYSDAL